MSIDIAYEQLIVRRDSFANNIKYQTNSNKLHTFDIHSSLTTDLESELLKLLWERDNNLHGVYHTTDVHNPYTWDISLDNNDMRQEIKLDISSDFECLEIEAKIKTSLSHCIDLQRFLRQLYWISSCKKHKNCQDDTFDGIVFRILNLDNLVKFKIDKLIIDYDITIHLIREMLRNVYPYSFIDLVKCIDRYDKSYLIEKVISEISFGEVKHQQLLDIKLPFKKPYQIMDVLAYDNRCSSQHVDEVNENNMMKLRVDLTLDQNSYIRLGLKWEDCLSDTDHALLNYAAFYYQLINRNTWKYNAINYNSDIYSKLNSKIGDVGRTVSAVTFAHKFFNVDTKKFRLARDIDSVSGHSSKQPDLTLLQMWEIFQYAPQECIYAIYQNLIDHTDSYDYFYNNNTFPEYQLITDILLQISSKFAEELLLLITHDYDPETLMPIVKTSQINSQFALITMDV